MSTLETLCVIPARGRSRGVPGKNLCPVAGTPLVGRAVQVARASSRVNRVVVSTDEPAIGHVASRYGAYVIERPPELSDDEATSESALLHALDTLERVEGYLPDLLVFLQCTAPLTEAADIDGTVEALLEQNADSALSVAESHRFLWRQGEGGSAEGVNHDPAVRLRRQDREPEFVETGAVYVMKVPGFREARHRFFGHTVLHVTPLERYLEVDEVADLLHAEVAARVLDRRARIARLPNSVAAVVLDFDGVLTDNTVLVHQGGRETVRCHRGDGMGIERLQKAGVLVLVLSKERNPVVTARCDKLRVECMQGIEDKLTALHGWLVEQGLEARDVVFLGNDVNDAECLQAVGCGVVVADAHPSVRRLATIELETTGGNGAVRELSDMIEEKRAKAEN